MDPVICLETELRIAQFNKDFSMAVIFDVDKAYGMERGFND